MADRTVKVTLTAQVQGYLQGIDQVQRKTREAGSEVEKLAAKRQAFQTLGVSALALGTAIAVGIGLAVAKYAEFDQAMSNANAILQETTANQKLLRDAALEAGGATVFTATESANAIEELGKAGIETSDILSGALTGSLDLAASAQLGVAQAAEITGITLKQFSLDGTQAGRVADVLSAGANKAVGSVEDLANGLKFVGPVAQGMNISLEDTVATLTLFADRGVIGEQAGTSLRGMLSSLTSPSKAANEELKRLNVSLYDGQGNFKGLENVAGELHRALDGASDAERDMSLGVIFGNQQLTTARVLVDAGAETWRDYRDAVDDSGIAARIAADRMDNLAGDVEKLGGAFDTALIQTGSGANDTLRGLVQTATFLVDAIGGLPEPVLNAGLLVAGLGAAVLLATGITFTGVPKWAAFKQQLDVLNISLGATALKAAAAGAAISVATIIIGALIQKEAEHKAQVDSFVDSFDQASGAVTQYTRSLAVKRLEEVGGLQSAKDLGISTSELVDALLAGPDATQKFIDGIHGGGFAAADLAQDLYLVSGELEDGRKAWERQTEAQGESEDQTAKNERVLASLEGQADATSDAVEGLSDQIRNFGKQTLDVRDAERQFEAAIDDLTDSISDNGTTLDINTEAGRANQAALDDIAKSTLELAAAKYDQTGSEDEAAAAIQRGREALIGQLAQLGITGAAAEAYADQLGLIPANVETVVAVKTDGAKASLNDLINQFQNRQISMSVALKGGASRADLYANAAGGLYTGGVKAFASGGFASGIYPYTPGGIHKFAEAGTEAYLSFQPQYRERNVGIWRESGRMLGVQAGPSIDYDRLAAAVASRIPAPPEGPIDLSGSSIDALGRVVEARTRTLLRQGVAG